MSRVRMLQQPDDGDPSARRRRRWTIGVAAVLIVAALVVVASVAARDEPVATVDSVPMSSTTPTIAPSTTATVSATTTTVSTTTTTVADTTMPGPTETGYGLEPACVEREPSIGTSSAWTPWPSDAVLSPLGATPSFVIELPQQRTPNSDRPEPVYSSVLRVPGGFLVAVRSDVEGSMLTLVDLDGTVRWQRCLAVSPTVLASPTGTYALLLQPEYSPTGSASWTLSTLSLVDGTPGPPLDGVVGARTQFVAVADRGPVFVHEQAHTVDEAADRMALLDLDDLEVVDVPYPPGSNGIDAAQLLLESNWWTGRLVHRAVVDGRTVVTAALVDGSWRTDRATLAAQPVGYYFTGDRGDSGGSGWFLQFRDGSGELRWERTDIVNPGGEGFTSGNAGDIVIARGCATASQGTCYDVGAEWTLYGLDAATGETRWERPGAWDVSVLADGKALVNEILDEPGAWSMIDTSTGELVAADQVWDDPSAFDYECCGGGDYVHVGVQGDVVVAANYGRVALWFPRERSVETEQITLP